MKQQYYPQYATVKKEDRLISDDDWKLLDAYPELTRLVFLTYQLKAMEPTRRGSFVLRVLDVLELTRRRFLRRISEAESNGGR